MSNVMWPLPFKPAMLLVCLLVLHLILRVRVSDSIVCVPGSHDAGEAKV